MNKISNYSGKLIILWIFLATVFIVLLLCIRRIPSESVLRNVETSLEIMAEEGDFPKTMGINSIFFQKNNCSDALMIGATICDIDTLTDFQNLLCAPVFPSFETSESVSEGQLLQMNNSVPPNYIIYGRYWHGYLLFLKPLLSFVDIRYIRLINIILIYSLLIYNTILLYKKINIFSGFLFFLANIIVGIVTLPLTIHFFTCFFIMHLAVAIILQLPREWLVSYQRMGLFFFIIGSLTVFFDLLTIPLITFTIPSGVLLLKLNKWPSSRLVLLVSSMWALGYGGLWLTKWIIAQIFTDFNMIQNAIGSVNFHSSNVLYDSETGTFTHFRFLILFLCALISFIVSIYLISKSRLYGPNLKKYYNLATLGWIPVLWIFAFQTHSFWHEWFVWRLSIGFIFNIGLFYYYTIKRPDSNEAKYYTIYE